MLPARVCAALLGFFAVPSEGDDNLPQAFPISLQDNRVFVDVMVNGHGPFSFLVDTGSSSCTVGKDLAARLYLGNRGVGSTDGAGEKKVDYETVHLSSVALGGIELGSMDVPALDVSALARAIGFRHWDGVLGVEIFRRHRVTIDAETGRMVVADSAAAPPGKETEAVSFELNGDGMPIVAGTINGLAGRFLIDTGDRSSLTLFGPFWRAHQLDRQLGRTVTAMTGYGIGGPIHGIVGRPASFQIGGITVPAPVTRLSLQKAGVFTSADYAGSIGMGVLKRFVATFDYPHKTLWLAKNSGFVYADNHDRAGLWLGLNEDGAVVVMDVVKDGPAARAGLREGDRVVSISGTTAIAENLFALRERLKDPRLAVAHFQIVRGPGPTQALTAAVSLQELIDPAR